MKEALRPGGIICAQGDEGMEGRRYRECGRQEVRHEGSILAEH